VVHAAPEVVYRVVTDFEHYLDWVSDLKKIDVLERDADGRALRYDYSLAPDVLTWHQSHGDLTSTLNGQYRFAPAPDGTLLTYDLEVELLVPIPAFVKSRAAYRIQSQALRELKSRAEATS
jgi:hypothetical protein